MHRQWHLSGAVLFGQSLQLPAQVSIGRIPQEYASEKALLQREPGLHRHALQAAVFESPSAPHHAAVKFRIYVDALVDQRGMSKAQLQLVCPQLLRQAALQELDLEAVHVGDAEMPYLAAFSSSLKTSPTSSGSIRESGLCRRRLSIYSTFILFRMPSTDFLI